MINIVQLCRECGSEVGSISEKKENMMLSTVDHVWCERCQAVMPASRDVAARLKSIEREVETYPRLLPQ
jgi:hypothetical protein